MDESDRADGRRVWALPGNQFCRRNLEDTREDGKQDERGWQTRKKGNPRGRRGRRGTGSARKGWRRETLGLLPGVWVIRLNGAKGRTRGAAAIGGKTKERPKILLDLFESN